MIVDKISIQPLYPTASYLNIRIGIEGTREPYETPEQALEKAYDLAQEFHKKHFPMFYKDGVPTFQVYTGEDLPVIQEKDR